MKEKNKMQRFFKISPKIFEKYNFGNIRSLPDRYCPEISLEVYKV